MNKIPALEFNKWKDKLQKKDYLLDIGCWDGASTFEFNKKCNAFGMDIDKNKLNLANPEIKKKLKEGDATKMIPFNRKFDWIYLSEVIEHVDNDKDLLKNISNSLKKEGHLILTTPKSIRYFEFWDPAWIRWKFLGGQKHYHYTLNELNKKLSKEGLIIEKYAIGGSFLWVFSRWLNVTLKHLLKLKKRYTFGKPDGFCNLKIIAKKIK